MQKLRCGNFSLALDRPLIMGILNVTPDSFSDGGEYFSFDEALTCAKGMIRDGADIIDVGGESSRPGAEPVSEQEELNRIIPIIEAIVSVKAKGGRLVPISVDTTKPAVMRAALAAGASMVNDINSLQADGALPLVAATNAAVCLMHMRGTPATMQEQIVYGDVVAEVYDFLAGRLDACIAAGISLDRIVIDPGFGFGKEVHHNVRLLRNLKMLTALKVPVLAGLSRKSFLYKLTQAPKGRKTASSLAAAMLAVERGASIVRVHDVGPTRDVLALLQAIQS